MPSKVKDMIFKVDTLTDKTVKLKLVTIMIGAVDVIIASVGSCGYGNDIFFLSVLIICFCFSFLLLLCTFLDMFKINCTSKGLDFVYHILGFFMLILASIILLTATSPSTCGVMEKTSSATLAIINGCLYLYISWVVLHRLRNTNGEQILPLYFLCICSRNPVVMPVKERPASTTTAVGLFPSDLPQSPQASLHQPSQSQQHIRYPTPTPTQIVQVKPKTPSPPPPPVEA